MRKLALAAAAGLAVMIPGCAVAQAYKPTPVDQCFSLSSLRIGPEHGGGGTPLPHEVMPRLAEAIGFCEQAVTERPTEGRLHARLARLRALAGDAPGALAAARKGAELGSPTAQVMLGVMHVDGVNVPRDYAASRDLFRRAAKAGDPYAHFNLAAMSANGWDVEQDDTEAAAWFRQAAQGGDALAMQLLGQRYDKSQAEQWFKKAAEAMYPDAQRNPLRVATLGRAEIDSAALLAWYQEKARTEPWAQAYLGMLSEAGQWVPQDYAAAASWYRRAGEAGYVPAQWRLARFYNEGRGVPQDRAEARRWGEMFQVQRCAELERAEAGANACDRLAADRYDPSRVVAGVDSFCMRHFAERAVIACSAAVKQAPSTIRYRTQLARAYAHTGRFAEARREAGAAAAKGSTTAMILMGVMSQRGLGTAVNEAEARAWYAKAADAGDARGASLSGRPVMYSAPPPAAQAESGDPRAMHNLAAQLEREKKYGEAIKLYERAAAKGFRPSEMNLAQMYEKGIGMKQDTAEARSRYRRLADLGDGEARYRAAKLAADAREYPEALKLYERGARDEDWRSILDLGELHEHGRGVPRDVARAVALYERVAKDSAWARFKLGVLHLDGDGIPRDYAKAEQWLRRSANDGNAGARNNLGWMHEKGLGMKVDYAAARELYLSAVGGGNAEAKGNAERFFAAGLGAPSGAAAVEWYRRGAEAGISSAQYRLGMMYARGEGVAKDERVALEWLVKAAQQGHPEARKEAAELLYKMGNDLEAAALGHEGAARRLADKMAAAGQPGAREELMRYLAAGPRRLPPPPVWPQGVSRQPQEDQSRTIAVRIAGVSIPQAAAVDAGMANVYDIIRWFPETDGKKK